MPQSTFQRAAHISFWFVAVLILLEAVDQFLLRPFGMSFDGLGIRPRTRIGLVGVVTSPLLHGGWEHLAANAVPLLVLLTILFWDRRYRPASALAVIWLVSGLGTWAIGRPNTVHVGASSLIFGLVAYLIVSGVVMRSWRAAFVALLVLLAFGGIFYGVLPHAGPISWEGHLCGAVAGAITGWNQHRAGRR
jgi:membrane associated rhomboid family serine protease